MFLIKSYSFNAIYNIDVFNQHSDLTNQIVTIAFELLI